MAAVVVILDFLSAHLAILCLISAYNAHEILSTICSAASEEKSFENVNGRTHGRTDDGRKVIIIAHPEHSSGELKTLKKHVSVKTT